MKKIIAFMLLASPLAFAGTYKIDNTHASVVFKINHLGFSEVYGMFGATDGTINWDAANPSKSSFEVTVKADSITTMVKKRDDHLKSPDFFNVKQFPNIVLKSKSIKKISENKFEATADLTLHGITKPVTFTLNQHTTGKDPWGKIRTGASMNFSVKRTDFGMTYMSKPGEVGDQVDMMISLEAVKQ